MLCRTFLDRLTEPPLVSHFLDVDSNDLDSVCRNYENLIADGGLDLAILGLGRNGHLGLNEPGSPPDSKTRVVKLAAETRAGVGRYGIDDPPTWGVTVGLGTLLEAREVWLFVRGADKSNVLRRVLREPVGSHLPASYLRNHPNSVIWADQAAAGADI
jgi:glucosamine-6-phosphate deaminase